LAAIVLKQYYFAAVRVQRITCISGSRYYKFHKNGTNVSCGLHISSRYVLSKRFFTV